MAAAPVVERLVQNSSLIHETMNINIVVPNEKGCRRRFIALHNLQLEFNPPIRFLSPLPGEHRVFSGGGEI
jgi:hypothetical protein